MTHVSHSSSGSSIPMMGLWEDLRGMDKGRRELRLPCRRFAMRKEGGKGHELRREEDKNNSICFLLGSILKRKLENQILFLLQDFLLLPANTLWRGHLGTHCVCHPLSCSFSLPALQHFQLREDLTLHTHRLPACLPGLPHTPFAFGRGAHSAHNFPAF